MKNIFAFVLPFTILKVTTILHKLNWLSTSLYIPTSVDYQLQGIEFIGDGELLGPEDVIFDPEKKFIYTGCSDGWIKRVSMNNSKNVKPLIEKWVNTGGRPLGIAFGLNQELIVADAHRGLLKVTGDGEVKLLVNEANGKKFKLTDGVDVAKDGTIYFTDASYKYSLEEFLLDILEAKPHGRFMSFDPKTAKTKVIASRLYFPNGVSVSPDQKSVIFCECTKSRCKRYIRKGAGEGTILPFVDNLPGISDNIKYDGQGHYWIAVDLSLKSTFNSWHHTSMWTRHLLLREFLPLMIRSRRYTEGVGGLIAVDLEGKVVDYYKNPALSLISSGNKIVNHLYCGSLFYPYLIRLDMDHQRSLGKSM